MQSKAVTILIIFQIPGNFFFNSNLNNHAPLRKRRVKSKSGWLTENIREAGRLIDKFLKKTRTYDTDLWILNKNSQQNSSFN